MKKLIIILVLTLFSASLLAEENLNSGAAQVSFLYPVASNGTESEKYINNFSFNILWGVNGGVNGAEIGGIANVNNNNVSGFQLGGVTNVGYQNSKGALFAGAANINFGSNEGVLISGACNFTQGDSRSFQFSAANIALGNSFMQFGAVNYSEATKGLQFGSVNYSNNSEGLQFGAVNYAGELKGTQFGVINIVGNADNGTPVGVLNIVKNGYYSFDLTGGEVFYANLNYKMGTEKLYTIFNVAYSVYKDENVYGTGFGFGSLIDLSPGHGLAVELTGAGVTVGENGYEGLNILGKFNINYNYILTKNIAVMAGPSVNTYITDRKINNEFGTVEVPYTIYESSNDKNKVMTWIGFNAGVTINI